jgi:hypothetical protein
MLGPERPEAVAPERGVVLTDLESSISLSINFSLSLGCVTLKRRRCTYRPSVIYFIVSKLLSHTHTHTHTTSLSLSLSLTHTHTHTDWHKPLDGNEMDGRLAEEEEWLEWRDVMRRDVWRRRRNG